MGFIFCGKQPLLVTRTQVSDPGPKGPPVSKERVKNIFIFLFFEWTGYFPVPLFKKYQKSSIPITQDNF